MTRAVGLAACCLLGMSAGAGAPGATTDEQVAFLAATIATKQEGTERWAVASGFPRNNVIAEIAKAVLVTVDAAKLPADLEAAALDRVMGGTLSTQARAALEIVRRETAAD